MDQSAEDARQHPVSATSRRTRAAAWSSSVRRPGSFSPCESPGRDRHRRGVPEVRTRRMVLPARAQPKARAGSARVPRPLSPRPARSPAPSAPPSAARSACTEVDAAARVARRPPALRTPPSADEDTDRPKRRLHPAGALRSRARQSPGRAGTGARSPRGRMPVPTRVRPPARSGRRASRGAPRLGRARPGAARRPPDRPDRAAPIVRSAGLRRAAAPPRSHRRGRARSTDDPRSARLAAVPPGPAPRAAARRRAGRKASRCSRALRGPRTGPARRARRRSRRGWRTDRRPRTTRA